MISLPEINSLPSFDETDLKNRFAVDEDTQLIWRIIAAFEGKDISKVLYNYGLKVLENKNIVLTFDEPTKENILRGEK